MNRRQILGRCAAVAAAACFTASAFAAEGLSSGPVTLVVPFAPGGNLDIVARIVAPALEKALGQRVIVDNRAGAGGAIGATYVSRAEPDGHTLLVTTPNAVGVLPQVMKTSYRLSSFAPVAEIATTPIVVMVRKNSPFKDMAALLAAARAKPGQVTVGDSGPATTADVAVLELENAAKIKLNVIGYKGSGPALIDLVGGQIDSMVDQLSSSASHIQQGTLRAVAVMSRSREPMLPDVPTLKEAGVADFEATTSTGLLAPANTPPATIDALNAAVRKALADPAVAAKLAQVASRVTTSSPADWGSVLQAEEKRGIALVGAGKLKTQ